MTQPVDVNGTVGTATETFVYDKDDELTDQTNFDGRRTTFSYDSGGRKIGETWVGASPSEKITYTYDKDNELTGVTDAFATLTFSYDSGGRQTAAITSSPGGQPLVTLSYGYNPDNNRTSLIDSLSGSGGAGQGIISYSYDAVQRLTTITSSQGGTAGSQVVFTYDSGGRVTAVSRTIGGSGTAVNSSLSYDNANRVTTLTHQIGGGSSLATYLYGYDNANRLTSENDTSGTYTYNATYTYDNANELTGVSGTHPETYTYDSGGNRNSTGYTTPANSGNELTASPGGITYAYDAEGNLVSKTQGTTTTTYAYDYRDRMTGVTIKSGGGTTVETYTYDALDRRIGVDTNSVQTWTVYDQKNPYADFNSSGAVQMRYLYGPAVDEILARVDSGGNTAWYLTDHLGSVRDLVSSSGTELDHIAYDSYGNILSESNAANGDRFKYAGIQYDNTTGLSYDQARWYDPVTGRFISRDPSGFGGGDTNLYRYVGNGPTDAIDPSGLAYYQGGEGQQGPEYSFETEYQTATLSLVLSYPGLGFGYVPASVALINSQKPHSSYNPPRGFNGQSLYSKKTNLLKKLRLH
jgi:RHS repeat-associated protein